MNAAQDGAQGADGVEVDRNADAGPDHLQNLDAELKDAERRVKDATRHLEQLKKQKERS